MNIKINIADKRPTVVGTPVIVCGNSDYTIEFTFDAEWAGETLKTARFVYVQAGKVRYQDMVFSGNTVAVPVLSDIREVHVGVYAGELQTTTPARIPCDRSILCGSGEAHETPDPDVYNQILQVCNELVGQVGEHLIDKNNPHGVTAAQVGATPASHATDKNNPHGVTAEQVGATPASHATDKNNPHGVTAAQVGARPNTWLPTAAEVGNLVYPVGAIYLSVNSTSPASLFGGTWTQLKDRFLLGAGDTYSNGKTGGAAEVTLTTNQMPKHKHNTAQATATENTSAQTFANYTVQSDHLTPTEAELKYWPNYTSEVGGGAAHNNMPPYLVVYMWKRTA